MQYSVICISLLQLLSFEVNAHPWNSVIGCYSIENDGTKFSFYCSNAEKSFNETYATVTLSEAMQKLNASAVIELKMCGCAIDTLVNAMKRLENVCILDISHSNYKSDDLFDESIVDVLFNRKLVKLNAAHNNLTEIPDEVFYKMPNLTVVDLSNNQLREFNWIAFKGAPELVEIHLQHNGFKRFNGGDIPEINKVKYLDLRDNSYNTPVSYSLLNSRPSDCEILSLLYHNEPIVIYISWRNIERLDLRCIKHKFMVRFNEHESITFRNGIVELHCNQNSFRNLRQIWANPSQMKNLYAIVSILRETLESMDSLDVRGSDLMKFDFTILNKMQRLRVLYISNCNLKTVINPSVLQSIPIKYFYAKGNQIQNVHEIIEHLNPSVEWLHLSGSFIGKMPSTAITKLKNLNSLLLSNTNLQMLDSHLFDQFESLEYIDISMNNLNKMISTISFPSRLRDLNVSGCRIENILDVIQLQGTKVEALDLSGNFVGTLNGTWFYQLTSLRYLHLKNTSLSFSNSNPFHKFNRLYQLDISKNNLNNFNFTTLSSTLFRLSWFIAVDCNIENVFDVIKLLGSAIYRLDLSENLVGKLNVSSFVKLTRLKYLHLRNTSLSINDGSNPFKQLNVLNVLDISHNNLRNFNWTVLSSTLARLKHLSVAECKITNALDLIKLLGSHIEHLDLSENIVGGVNASTFERFKELRVLHLSNTSPLNFDFNILENSKKLKLLVISFNHFVQLNVSLKFNNLQTLDLRGCELNEIHNLDKMHLPNLELLGISENHLSCETLERLKNEWPRLKFIDNDQSQKNHQICQKPIETTTDIPTKVLEPFKFKATHIVSMITSVVFFIAIIFILFRYILCEKRCDNYLQNNDNEMVVLQRVDGVGAANNDTAEHIYEEIVEQTEPYDHLNFDPQPSSALQQHYENAPEPID